MFVDILFFVIIIAAVLKGYSKGLIVAVFSFFSIIVGIAVALKLSASVAVWLQKSTTISAYWLPFIAFALVIIGVAIIIRLGAKAIEKAAQFAMLGWANKLGGIVLFFALYISLFSVFLFYANKMQLLQAHTLAQSKTYFFIEPWAPQIIAGFSKVLPFFKDVFVQLESFFQKH